MKRIFAFFFCLTTAAFAASPVGMLPEDKEPVVVSETERNPFGKKVVKEQSVAVENEESIIRGVIEKLPVSGVTAGRTGRKVLLGALVLEEGRVLPSVIPRQTEKVRVNSVAEEKVELGFVESDGTSNLRRIVVSLNLRPKVQFKVPKPGSTAAGSGQFDGVLTSDELKTVQ